MEGVYRAYFERMTQYKSLVMAPESCKAELYQASKSLPKTVYNAIGGQRAHWEQRTEDMVLLEEIDPLLFISILLESFA